LLATISKVQWNTKDVDRLLWVGKDQYEYSVKSGYSVLNKEDLMQSLEVFKLLWSLNMAPSVIVCVWRLLLDKLPTRANLSRRGVQLGNTWCPLCQEGVETTQHLLSLARWPKKFGISVKALRSIECGKGCGWRLCQKFGIIEIRWSLKAG